MKKQIQGQEIPDIDSYIRRYPE